MECQGIPAKRGSPNKVLQDTKDGSVLGGKTRGASCHLAMIGVNAFHRLCCLGEAELRGEIADNLWQYCVRHGLDMRSWAFVPFQIAP